VDRLLKGRVSDFGHIESDRAPLVVRRAKEGARRGGTPARIGLAIRSGARRREHACKGQSGE
jgi:hypothetical protein